LKADEGGAMSEYKHPARVVSLFVLLSIALLPCFGQTRSEKVERKPSPVSQERQRQDSWVPPDIDALVPAVDDTRSCSLSDVLNGVGRKVQELIGNLERFSPTEFVEHQDVDRKGKLGDVQDRKFDYQVQWTPGASGYMNVNELRTESNFEGFPENIATMGLPSLILIFHPLYARDFQMQCEGLGSWQGKPAWQIRFEQRQDRPNHMSYVQVHNQGFAVPLRGRAWILADSYQAARLETDIMQTIPQIGLRLEHMSVDYGPVPFRARKTELWLPLSAELYMDLRGHRFYRRHRFAQFELFSVQVNQTIGTIPN
jgi:hypothetical protein